MKCKHLNRIGLVRLAQPHPDSPNLPMLATICDDCNEWLPLGPSNDAPSEVQVEMRAAELSMAWEPVGGVGHLITGDEAQGWNGWPYRQPVSRGELVGFLAAQIRNHERDLGDVNWAGHHMADHALKEQP